MPNILVHIPQGPFPGAARDALVQRINDAAADTRAVASSVVLHDFASAAGYRHLQHLVGAAHAA